MKRILFFAAAFAAAPLGAQVPFGLTAGMSVAALAKEITMIPIPSSPYFYAARTAPAPNAEFTTYLYLITPKYGLCQVMATSEAFASDAAGVTTRDHFSRMEAALGLKYGNDHKTDTAQMGSMWATTPELWMMGLAKRERQLIAVWSREHLSTLPAPIQGIILMAQAPTPDTATLVLQYRFSHMTECQAEADSAKNATL